MNTKQVVVMWIAIGILAMMCLYPPWVFHGWEDVTPKPEAEAKVETMPKDIFPWLPYNTAKTKETLRFFEVRGPYQLVFIPPVLQKENSQWKAELDWIRLLPPMAVVLLVAAGLIITLKRPKKD